MSTRQNVYSKQFPVKTSLSVRKIIICLKNASYVIVSSIHYFMYTLGRVFIVSRIHCARRHCVAQPKIEVSTYFQEVPTYTKSQLTKNQGNHFQLKNPRPIGSKHFDLSFHSNKERNRSLCPLFKHLRYPKTT